MEKNLRETTKKNINNWWVSLLVGILAIAVGVLSVAQPFATIGILTAFFIAYFFVSGMFEIYFAISNRANLDQWGWTLAGGIINFVFAIILLAVPVSSMLVFIYFVSFYILLQSLMGIWGSFSLKSLGVTEWWAYLIIAILGVVFSLILILQPVVAASFITVIFAAVLICYGLFRIFYAFRLKKLKNLL